MKITTTTLKTTEFEMINFSIISISILSSSSTQGTRSCLFNQCRLRPRSSPEQPPPATCREKDKTRTTTSAVPSSRRRPTTYGQTSATKDRTSANRGQSLRHRYRDWRQCRHRLEYFQGLYHYYSH